MEDKKYWSIADILLNVILSLTIVYLAIALKGREAEFKELVGITNELIEEVEQWDTAAHDALDYSVQLGADLIECRGRPLDSISEGRLRDELIKRGYQQE